MEGEEIFGSYKRKANLTPRLEGDSHRHDCVNFAHPCVSHIIATSSVNIEEHVVDQIEEDVEASCGDGFWHIKRCPLMLHVLCFALQKIYQTFLCYKDNYQADLYWCPYLFLLRVVLQFLSAPLKLHKF
jgi:hypothetical protein